MKINKTVSFNPADPFEDRMFAHAKAQGYFATYVKRLIARDMEPASITRAHVAMPDPTPAPRRNVATPAPAPVMARIGTQNAPASGDAFAGVI